MSREVAKDLLLNFGQAPSRRIKARRQLILEVFLEADPELREKLGRKVMEQGIEKGIEKGRLLEARAALHRVLARRQLALSRAQAARIEKCTDSASLERWLEQAVTAATAAEALQ